MSYATQDDLQALIPAEQLLLLSDDNDFGSIDGAVVDTALANASELIDSYLADRYELPFAEVPAILKNICVRVAGYELHARRGEVPDTWSDLRQYALSMLEKMASGQIRLGAAMPKQAATAKMEISAADPLFSRDELDKY